MKKPLLIVGAVAGVVGAAAISVGSASAYNANANGGGYGYERQLETKAQILDLSTDELRERLQEQTLYQIAEDQGVSQDQLHEQIQSQAQERWQAAGLSDEEIQARQQAMGERQADCDGSGVGQGGQYGQKQQRRGADF